MKYTTLALAFLLLFVPTVAWSQCSNSPTPSPSPTPTVVATATPTDTAMPTSTPTPFPNAWLQISPTHIGASDSWLPSQTMSGYYQKYLVTLNKAPFDVTFTDTFTGDDPAAFSALFSTCTVNSDGTITVAKSHGCAWWVLTDDFGVDAVYVATSVPMNGQTDPASPYSVPVAH